MGQAFPKDEWFLSVRGADYGPLDFDKLCQLKQQGLLQPDHKLRRSDSYNWQKAGTVANLFEPPAISRSPSDTLADPEDRPVVAASDKKKGRGSNYFSRHWRGELSLPVSYWVNGFIGNIAAAVVVALLRRGFDTTDEFKPEIALVLATSIWLTIVLVAIWQAVGVWRSATIYSAKRANGTWGGIAKFMICIAMLRLAGEVLSSGIPQIVEFAKIYGGDHEVGSYKFSVLAGGTELEFSGGITFGAAKAFQQFADALPSLRVVHLTSQGGRIAEAERIAAYIKEHGLSTYVPNFCVSACTTIFLGGRERIVNSKSRLGFHQPDFPGLSDQERREMIANEQKRLVGLGVSPSFAKEATSAPPTKMWYPSIAELVSDHIATGVLSDSGPPPKKRLLDPTIASR